MSVVDLPVPLQNTSSYHNFGFHPHFNPNMPMFNGPSNYNIPPQGHNQAIVAPHVVAPSAGAPAANNVPPNNGR